MSSIRRNGTNMGVTTRQLREEYEEMATISNAYWDSMVSIARYTQALEAELEQETIGRIRDQVGLDPMAAMVIDDPTSREAA